MTFRILVLIAIITACTPRQFDTEGQLIDFVQDPDHGLKQHVEVNNVTITITNKPTDLLICQEIRNKKADSIMLAELKQKYSAYWYFSVSFSNDNKEALHAAKDMDQYSELLQTMSFHMNEYVNLTTNTSDTIPVADFMLNRTFGISKTTDLLFVFSKEKSMDKEWIQFNLNEFGLNTGNQRFRFRKNDLDNIPPLAFTTIIPKK